VIARQVERHRRVAEWISQWRPESSQSGSRHGGKTSSAGMQKKPVSYARPARRGDGPRPASKAAEPRHPCPLWKKPSQPGLMRADGWRSARAPTNEPRLLERLANAAKARRRERAGVGKPSSPTAAGKTVGLELIGAFNPVGRPCRRARRGKTYCRACKIWIHAAVPHQDALAHRIAIEMMRVAAEREAGASLGQLKLAVRTASFGHGMRTFRGHRLRVGTGDGSGSGRFDALARSRACGWPTAAQWGCPYKGQANSRDSLSSAGSQIASVEATAGARPSAQRRRDARDHDVAKMKHT